MAQTAPGRVSYKVQLDLAEYPAGSTVTADQLAGLNVPALEEGGFLKREKGDPIPCPHCSEHGKNKKEREQEFKDLLELREHYGKEHPGLAAPTEED